MGQVKNDWIAAQERGWIAPETFVCASCVKDAFLKQLLRDHAESKKCDYCKRRRGTSIAAPMEVLVQAVSAAVSYRYSDPAEAGSPRDDGEWVGEIVHISDVLDSLPFFCDDKVYDDVMCSFQNIEFTPAAQGHWASSHPHQIYTYGWNHFVDTVMHRSRYFFMQEEADDFDHEQLSPANFLAQLCALLRNAGLVQELPERTALYRVRYRSKSDRWLPTVAEIGAPPKEIASAGRMNPIGIPYLYTALDRRTAVLEAEAHCNGKTSYAWARFSTKRVLRVIDLSRLPRPPSVFDEEQQDLGEAVRFFSHFVKEILQPLSKSGSEHLHYVPTQIVSEYLATAFRTEDHQLVDGLIYPSTVSLGGKNLVLFPRREESWKKVSWPVYLSFSGIVKRAKAKLSKSTKGK
jgi:RES domain-containing protein